MGLKRVTDASREPVDLVEARKQCELIPTDSTHDDFLLQLIETSRRMLERRTRRAFITQTHRLSIDSFPVSRIYLPRPPLQSVTSVIYENEQGNLVTLAEGTDYRVLTDPEPGFIEPAYNKDWPTPRPTSGAVRITYVAGFGAKSSDVPIEYRQLILQLVAFYFSSRGDLSNFNYNTSLPRHLDIAMDSLRCGATLGFYGVTK